MNSNKKFSNQHVLLVVLIIGFFFVGAANYNKRQNFNTKESEYCRNMMRMNAFLKLNYPNLDIECDLSSLCDEDFKIINSDYDIYFRFLSLISGKKTPFNLEYGHYTVKNHNWIRHENNIELAEWYQNHQTKIECKIFNEFYYLEKGIREGPKIIVDDFDEYLRISEVYFDSIYDRMDKFQSKYLNYLLQDSVL